MRALIGAQLLLLAVVGVATAFSFSRFTLDERAHFSYVESVAREGHIPEVGKDLVSSPIAAVYEGVYPAPPRVPPARQGLGGQSYEGFQPPLYYLVATPAFAAAGGDYVRKLRLVRMFNLALLFATVGLLWLLARRVAGADGDPGPLFALALTVLLWPGFVLRAVTVSNAALELLLGVALALAAWVVWERREPRLVPVLGLLLGIGLLTRVSLVAFAPALAVVSVAVLRAPGLPRGRVLALAAVTAALPVILLAPWLAHNLHVYDAFTGEDAIRTLQEPLLNPDGRQFGLAEARDGLLRLTRAPIPDEWWVKFLSAPWRYGFYALALAMVVVTAVGLRRMEPDRARRLVTIGVLPVAAALVWMAYALFGSNWDFFLPRYLYPELAVTGLVAAAALARLVRPRALMGTATALTVALAGLWLYLGTSVTPFTG